MIRAALFGLALGWITTAAITQAVHINLTVEDGR